MLYLDDSVDFLFIIDSKQTDTPMLHQLVLL